MGSNISTQSLPNVQSIHHDTLKCFIFGSLTYPHTGELKDIVDQINDLAHLSGESISYTQHNTPYNSALVLVVMDGTIVVGVSVFFFNYDKREDEYYLNLGNVAVNPEYRQRGIFKLMLNVMLSMLRIQMKYWLSKPTKVGGICLKVDHDNLQAREIYLRTGFVKLIGDYKYSLMYREEKINVDTDIKEDLLVVKTIISNSVNVLEKMTQVYPKDTNIPMINFCNANISAAKEIGESFEEVNRFLEHYSSIQNKVAKPEIESIDYYYAQIQASFQQSLQYLQPLQPLQPSQPTESTNMKFVCTQCPCGAKLTHFDITHERTVCFEPCPISLQCKRCKKSLHYTDRERGVCLLKCTM